MHDKIANIIFSFVAVFVLFIILVTGLFSIWVFVGFFIIGALYIFGYFYVLNYYKFLTDTEKREQANKKKLDWCWNKANKLLQNMIGGQGLTWNKGVGRKSILRHYHNGVQLCGYRSMEGYLETSQQLVVLIYDIENDDIAAYYANPTPHILSDHFSDFKPFQSKESFGGGFDPQQGRYPHRYRRPSRGITIHTGDEGYDNFDNFSSRAEPSDDVVNAGLKKLQEK